MKKINRVGQSILKNRAFTLIELLAVIVILAIIALIAVPIILNIIEDSKNSSNKRSIELYAKAVGIAVEQYQIKNPQDKDITLEKIKPYIEYKGNSVECDTEKIYKDGTIYLAGCMINGEEVEYTYGKEQEEINEQICKLVEGTSKTVGAKYICILDEERAFYVLENNESSNDITLLMDRNYTDLEVPSEMPWCDYSGPNPNNNTCNHDMLDTYIEKIQIKFGNKLKVGIPSYEQMKSIGCTKEIGSCPQWSYGYLSERGYWTSTVDSSASNHAWFLYFPGYIFSGEVTNYLGIRPTITISKSSLN